MQRYFIEIAYKGTNYHGWQVQPNAITIQGVLTNVIGIKIKEPLVLIGAGRTDTGVHASQFFAHFDSEQDDLADRPDLIYQINNFLPIDISLKDIFKVTCDAHARFDAVSRTYKYYITKIKNPFNYEFCDYIYGDIDIKKMNEAAKVLLDHTDFECFSKVNTDVKSFDCDIQGAEWQHINNELVFKITANRFLRNMVRAIVGTLLDVGYNKTSISDIKKILESKNRSMAGVSVPAKGLFLTKIKYPEQIRIN